MHAEAPRSAHSPETRRFARTLADDLRRQVLRHNLLQVFLVVVLVPGTIALWAVSFWLIHWLIERIGETCCCEWSQVAFYGSWAGLAALAFWGYQHRNAEIEPENFEESEFSEFAPARDVIAPLDPRHDSREVFLLYSILMAAPKTTILAIRAMRSWIRCDRNAPSHAANVLRQLAVRPGWVPATDFVDHGPGLWLLDRLDLIWTQIDHGHKYVRIRPGAKRSDFA
mgnify:CR=1 FL=1